MKKITKIFLGIIIGIAIGIGIIVVINSGSSEKQTDELSQIKNKNNVPSCNENNASITQCAIQP